MKYQLHTFGCKVNTYDSGLIQKNLGQHGFELQSGGIHVLNTCAVTAEATLEAVRLVRRIKAQDPFSTVVVTGCAAQVDTEAFEKLPSVDLIVANSHKGLLPFIIQDHFKRSPAERLSQRLYKSNIFHKEDLEAGGGEEEHHTRSYLKIQDGCNSFCTYCVIPFARGKSRSIPRSELTAQIRRLEEQGVREVVLTGVHIGDYEDTTAPINDRGLEGLLEYVLANTSIARIRLTSLEPIEVTERLLALYQDPRMCAHFHMSIQSADTVVLKDMKRKYTQAEVIHSLHRIREVLPEAFIGMDVIAGFPTENEELFESTYKTLAETPWTRLHVFPYSERPGTYAARLENVEHPHVRKERAKKLRELSLHRYQSEALKQIGQTKSVLALKNKGEIRQGLASDYWPIKLNDPSHDWQAGQEYQVLITGVEESAFEGSLMGRLVEKSLSLKEAAL